MSSIDLRTRAREAAKKRGQPRHWTAYENGYIDGFLAHAAQQPSREQIARAVGEVVSNAANHPVPHVVLGRDIEPLREKITDAVLALFNGADR